MSTNKKYMTPDLSDSKTMEESIKRVRSMLMEKYKSKKAPAQQQISVVDQTNTPTIDQN